MILCLDAGNTRLKWGLWSGSTWLARGALAYAALEALSGALPARPARILACNVAGAEVAARIAALADALAAPLDWFASTAAGCGVTNGYARPEQLGADRWAALIGAHHLHRGAAIVVMAGTATTIDFLDSEGKFRGGLILPGLALMRASLARHTAGLPEARGAYRELPANTDDAIESGCLMATLGAIERLRALAGRLASAEPTLIVSGGAAEALWPHLPPPKRQIEQLVLEGLAIAATASSSS
ncbi:MAG: type III pantothenate kinase [Rhodocyclaceae bacterium]|nr:type III pantothenate kinase [Rhodocyclaceae bacterium]